VGNHDLYVMPRSIFFQHFVADYLSESAPSATPPLYYDHVICDGCGGSIRLIFLDGYEISDCGATSLENQRIAQKMLAEKNKNLADPQGDWFADLAEEDLRFVPYNGAMSDEQLRWLRRRLEASRDAGQRCVVFTHMPLLRACCRPSGLMWGAERVLEVLHRPDLIGVVLAVVAGRSAHPHHRTPSPLAP
jgi:manganese-dependent ADP-ribose/CDP-alcohol diphosphatase